MGLGDITRQQIEREIDRLLSMRNWQSEKLTKHILKPLGAYKNPNARKKLRRTRDRMEKEGKIFHYNIGINKFFTKKRPKKAHMNTKTIQFLEAMEGCTFVEEPGKDGNLKFWVAEFYDFENVDQRALRNEVHQMKNLFINLYNKQLTKVKEPLTIACVFWFTNYAHVC